MVLTKEKKEIFLLKEDSPQAVDTPTRRRSALLDKLLTCEAG